MEAKTVINLTIDSYNYNDSKSVLRGVPGLAYNLNTKTRNSDMFILHAKNNKNESDVLGVFNDLKVAREVAKDFLDVSVKSLPKIKKDIANGDFDLQSTRGVKGCLAWRHRRVWVEFVELNKSIELGQYFLKDN